MIGISIAIPGQTAAMGGFSPQNLAGLVLWLRADLGVSLNVSNVSGWADQSGQGNHCNQATPANQPTYTASDPTFNGQPTIAFAGTVGVSGTELACVNNPTISANTTCFVAARPSAISATYQSIIIANAFRMYSTLSGSSQWGAFYNNDVASGTTLVANTTYILTEVVRNFNDVDFYTNATKATVATGTAFNASTGLGIGGNTAGPLLSPFNGKLGEVIIYGRTLSASEITLVQKYMGARSGVAI